MPDKLTKRRNVAIGVAAAALVAVGTACAFMLKTPRNETPAVVPHVPVQALASAKTPEPRHAVRDFEPAPPRVLPPPPEPRHAVRDFEPVSRQVLPASVERESARLRMPDLSADQLATAAATDPRLQAALCRWCDAARAGKSLPKNAADELLQASARTTLDASTLLAIANCVKKGSSNDALLIGTLSANAAGQLHRDLPRYAIGTSDYATMLKLLIQTKALFWHAIDHGQTQLVPQMQIICEDLSQSAPGNDPALQNAKIYGVTGAAGCLYLLHQNEKALSRLDAIPRSTRLNAEQRASVDWVRGLILFNSGHYIEAINYFEQCANGDGRFEHADDARQMLMYAHAERGDSVSTAAALKKFLTRRQKGIAPAEERKLLLTLRDELVRAKQLGRASASPGMIVSQ